MIIYEPFWKTLKESDESSYTLIYKHKISSNTLCRIRKNQPLSTVTINDLCRILNCNVENIIKYIPNDNDPKL